MAKKSANIKAMLSRQSVKPKLQLSTGSTLFNLGLTDNPHYGLLTGHYYFFVGDSSSGKTWICLNIFAEAAYNPAFNDYRLIYDNVEDGALMNVSRFFGKKTSDRLEAPRIDNGFNVSSETVEDFYDNVHTACDRGIPFIYLLDSQDALTSTASDTKFQKQRAARKKQQSGKKAKEAGSMGDGKPKIHSENIRKVLQRIKKMGSMLIVVSQTRDNLGFGFEKKTRSGGRALRFYATTEAWTSIRKKHKKEVRGAKIQIGIDCQIQIKKNRITGDEPQIVIPIMNDIGIDDTGSMVDYLLETGHWESSGKTIVAEEFDFEGNRRRLIKQIEADDELPMLRSICGRVWDECKAEARPARKSRYAAMDEE